MKKKCATCEKMKKMQAGGSKAPKAPAATSIPSMSSAKKTDTLSKRKPIYDTSLISNAAKTKIMQKGGSFPDLNKDGKVTRADILKGRGVIKKMGGITKKK